uniref:Uncharacterized protein n=1 Tax=Oscillatoriales cyanobacterium SpSt-402 TaxID=2282168 RepID=A0A832M2T9_9CYAN
MPWAFWVNLPVNRRSEQLQGLEKIVASLQTREPSVKDWRNYVDRLSYQTSPFAMNEQKAWMMAQDLLLGIGRVGQVEMAVSQQPDAWHFSLLTSIHEQLLIVSGQVCISINGSGRACTLIL